MEDYDNHLIYRIIRYGLTHHVFTLTNLYNDLQLTEDERRHVNHHFIKSTDTETPNHLIASLNPNYFGNHERGINFQDLSVMLLLNGIFQYNDYLEIKAASEAAKESKRLAWIAIGLSLIVGVIQIVVSIIYSNNG
jgi:hypothetical protein